MATDVLIVKDIIRTPVAFFCAKKTAMLKNKYCRRQYFRRLQDDFRKQISIPV